MDLLVFKDIEDAIVDIKNGKIIIVADDEHRENEGDFIVAAELVTPEIINFLTIEGRGLICVALTPEICKELELELMVQSNSAIHRTNFTITVDLIGHGCTTGISSQDRAKTILALADGNTKPSDLGRPGHMFPIMSDPGGVLRRAGHTEAAVELARLAGLKPAGVLVEIMNPDGTMARYGDLRKVAQKFGMSLITVRRLAEYIESKNKL